MAKFNEVEIRGKLRAEFEIDTNGMFINTKAYWLWLEDKEVQRRIDCQEAKELTKKIKDV